MLNTANRWSARLVVSPFKFGSKVQLLLTRFVRTLLVVTGLVSFLNAGPRGVLEFEDGNRVTGELSKTTADRWVFQSARFEELRPARADAVFRPEHATAAIPQEATPVLHSQTVKDSKKSSDPTHSWWRPHSLRGNIYGLISSDAGDSKEEGGLELRAVWAPLGYDEFRLDARWLDKGENDTQGDLRTSLDAYWRVDVEEHWFTYLGSDLEWDGFKVAGLKPRYFLQRYQVGFGYNLVKSDRVMSRVGATWNFFRFESDAIGVQFNTDAPSLLIENEIDLP